MAKKRGRKHLWYIEPIDGTPVPICSRCRRVGNLIATGPFDTDWKVKPAYGCM